MESILNLFFVLLCLLFYYNWRRRWLNFHAWGLPGPFSLPIIGTVAVALRFNKDLCKTISKICKSQPPVFRLWFGNHLYILNSKPEDLEVLLNNFLEKSPDVYGLMEEVMKNNLLSAPVDIWRSHRRAINPSFNSKLLASFHGIFIKNSKNLTNTFLEICDTEVTDILTLIWKCNLDISFESIMGIDPSKTGNIPIIPFFKRAEEILIERITKFWLINKFVWKFSKLREELVATMKSIDNHLQKILMQKREDMQEARTDDDDLKQQRFLERLITLENSKFTQTDIIDETVLMLVGSSETVSVTVNSVILVLGLYPEIQDKIYDEVYLLLEDEDDFSKNISKLDYLERVIKETMRLLPPIPYVMRSVDSDVTLGSYKFPTGSHLVVPITHLDKRPDLWPNPLKFDPDRFLPEEVAKRHRCAYMPFSFGPRNCIGLNYGMLSTKIMVAYIVKNFTIKALNYSSLEELEFKFHIVLKPVGYRIMLSKRKR